MAKIKTKNYSEADMGSMADYGRSIGAHPVGQPMKRMPVKRMNMRQRTGTKLSPHLKQSKYHR